MSDVDELGAAFEAGILLRPDPSVPNLLDLARAVASVCGIPDVSLSAAGRELAQRLGAREHLVLVLVDGLGVQLIEDAGRAAALIRERLALELRSVFPASTAVALTTLATAEWPAQHAITGWWTHLGEIGGAATILPFRRRSDERSLLDLGLEPGGVFLRPPLLPRMKRETLTLLPEGIAGSVYSRFWTGGTAIAGYRTLADAIALTLEAVRHAPGPSFTYCYLPLVDHAAHAHGAKSPRTVDAVRAVDRLFEALAGELRDEAVVALTADHGHLDAGDDERLLIRDDDGLPELLEVEPAGDSRVLHFHVREGATEMFATRFRERFGGAFYLLTTDEVDALRLLGPEPLSSEARDRLGDLVAISRGAHVLGYEPANGARELLRHQSHHSGLRPEEMRVPLVLGSSL